MRILLQPVWGWLMAESRRLLLAIYSSCFIKSFAIANPPAAGTAATDTAAQPLKLVLVTPSTVEICRHVLCCPCSFAVWKMRCTDAFSSCCSHHLVPRVYTQLSGFECCILEGTYTDPIRGSPWKTLKA